MAPAETSQSSSPEAATGRPHAPHPAGAALVVGALGVVFGDIGTSPLYALRETFLHGSGMAPTPEHVLGVLSMLFWAVTLTVTIKYVVLIMRADNKGEGGVLALATLATRGLSGKARRTRRAILVLAVVGLALFYGDAMITPAVSVMSAVEGLSAAAPAFTLRSSSRAAAAASGSAPEASQEKEAGCAAQNSPRRSLSSRCHSMRLSTGRA